MDNQQIQKRCAALLEELGVPGFIVFGWKKENDEFGVVYSFRKSPPNAVVKGLSWALNDITQKKL